MSTVEPSKRKQPHAINRWYLTLYQRHHQRWFVVIALVTVAYTAFSGAAGLLAKWGLVAWPFEVLALGWWLHKLLSHFRKTSQTLTKDQKAIVPVDPTNFSAFLSQAGLPTAMVSAGYVIIEGGTARDLFRYAKFSGYSATSRQLNQELRRRSAADQPTFHIEIPPHSLRWAWLPGGEWTTRQLAKRVGWREALVKNWRLPELARQIMLPVIKALPAFGKGTLVNESKVRMTRDLQLPEGAPWPLAIERTDYLSDLVTGHITGVQVHDAAGHDLFDGYASAFERGGPKQVLKPMAISGCSNQVGVSAMALGVSRRRAPDGTMQLIGHFYFVEQSMQNLASPGLLAPSGSGSLDWSDVTDAGDTFIEYGMQREMQEETWVGDWKALTARGSSTVITGYGRMLHRGGKPEFYGLIVAPREAQEHGIDRSEEVFATRSFSIEVWPLTAARCVDVLRGFMQQHRESLSHPLYMCLLLLIEFLEESPQAFTPMVERAASFGEI